MILESARPARDASPARLPPLDAARDGLLLVTCAWGLFAAVFDKMTQTPRELSLFWAILLLALLDQGPGWAAFRRRVTFTGVVFTASSVIGALVCFFAERKKITLSDTLRQYLTTGAWAGWLATVWIYSPLGLELVRRRREDAASDGQRGFPGFLHAQALILFAFGLWSLITSFSSTHPTRSLTYFRTEIGLYVPLFLLWIRFGAGSERLAGRFKRMALAAMVLGTLVGAATAGAYMAGGAEARKILSEYPFFYATLIETDGPEWRLLAPFGHHNRMAYFSLLCILLAPLALVGATGPPRRARFAAVGALVALAFANLQWTLNRGAILALGAALVVQVLLAIQKRSLGVIALAVVVGTLALGPSRERLATLFEPTTYNAADSTVALRFQHWRVALEMIDRNHSLGIGYGWKHVEKNYDHIARRNHWPINERVHAHNVWLEIGAESGIPAIVIFTAWQLARGAWLVSIWRRRRALDPGMRWRLIIWIGVEIAILVYSVGNLPTRRSLGLITFAVWGVMADELARFEAWLRSVREPEPELAHTPEAAPA